MACLRLQHGKALVFECREAMIDYVLSPPIISITALGNEGSPQPAHLHMALLLGRMLEGGRV